MVALHSQVDPIPLEENVAGDISQQQSLHQRAAGICGGFAGAGRSGRVHDNSLSQCAEYGREGSPYSNLANSPQQGYGRG